MNLQEMRDLVRAQLDLDDTDLPDVLLDAFLQEGYDRVIGLEGRWPFFEQDWTITTDATGRAPLPDGVRSIEMMRTADAYLAYINVRWGAATFGPAPTAGTPAGWLISNRTLALLPPPTAPTTVYAHGFRGGSDWIGQGAGSECDCDRRLHIPICWYACSLGYAQQEDEVLEQTYNNRFNESARLARDAIMRSWTGSPKQMSYTSYPRSWGIYGRQPQLVFVLPGT